MQIIEPFLEGNYYHIYNRGINGTNIFSAPDNYNYFKRQYKKYLANSFQTIAYCLLKNHFHLLVYVKENVIVNRHDNSGLVTLNPSKQFGHFLNSYAQAYNKMFTRTGGLFETPFQRKRISTEAYLTSVIFYIHSNAQHHNFVADFRN